MSESGGSRGGEYLCEDSELRGVDGLNSFVSQTSVVQIRFV